MGWAGHDFSALIFMRFYRLGDRVPAEPRGCREKPGHRDKTPRIDRYPACGILATDWFKSNSSGLARLDLGF
jgi:hypothetical protein